MEKNDPNKRSDADREASELQGKTRKASLEADNPGKSKDYDKASQGMLGGITVRLGDLPFRVFHNIPN
jgi:hypothetical protein